MKEILANNLQSLFDNTSLNGKCTYKGNTYEVWEISDEDFKTMCNMSEEEFEKVCPDGMWRSSEGSNMGNPNYSVIINKNELLAWADEENMYQTYIGAGALCTKRKEYQSLLEYFCDCVGASQPRNVCALATDLARYNNMKMSELFNVYEG